MATLLAAVLFIPVAIIILIAVVAGMLNGISPDSIDGIFMAVI